MKQAIIIGGGIIGLSSAYYLEKSGWKVTVLDKGDFLDNCSYGNAGYVCPSHFIPLASPGIIRQGLKWILNARSPFYVEPRLDRALLSWGWKFMRSATKEKVERGVLPLRDIALLSQKEYRNWESDEAMEFEYVHKGLLEIFQTDAGADHAKHMAEKANELHLEAALLSRQELEEKEPGTRINARGALFFKCDSHLYPNKLMKALISYLKSRGVDFRPREEVSGFEFDRRHISKVITKGDAFAGDEVIIATGSWTRELVAMLGVRIPLVPGRGYSVTLENTGYHLNHPAVLVEGRVALTPLDDKTIRFGGTMEITSVNRPPRYERVQGILDTVQRYFPDFVQPLPSPEKIWFGFRPCSADGLPYIGRTGRYKNLVLATGHAMLGLSLGAGTGKLVGEIIDGQIPSMDINPFRVDRFTK
ncbi:MAG: NAD(P)/FAD-dependent oxidoreductase [Chitinophagales bacterium]